MSIEEYNANERAKLETQSLERYISGERRSVKPREERNVELDPNRFEPTRLPGELEPIAVSAKTGEPLTFEDCDKLSEQGRGVWLLGNSPPDKKDCKGNKIIEVKGVFGDKRFFMVTNRPGWPKLEDSDGQRQENESEGSQGTDAPKPRLEEE
jgi:hypothetical protein